MPIIRTLLNRFLFYFVVHLGLLTHMFRHVSRQNHSYHSLTEDLSLISMKGFNKIIFGCQEYLHALRGVPIFLDCLVMESQCPFSHKVHVIWVVKTIVCKIVTGCCRYGRHQVPVT